MSVKICEECGKEFQVRHWHDKWCGPICKDIATKRRHRLNNAKYRAAKEKVKAASMQPRQCPVCHETYEPAGHHTAEEAAARAAARVPGELHLVHLHRPGDRGIDSATIVVRTISDQFAVAHREPFHVGIKDFDAHRTAIDARMVVSEIHRLERKRLGTADRAAVAGHGVKT